MSPWTREELDAIGSAEELELASVRRDGTLRRPVTSIAAPEARAATLKRTPRAEEKR